MNQIYYPNPCLTCEKEICINSDMTMIDEICSECYAKAMKFEEVSFL